MNVEYDLKEILTDIKQSFDKMEAKMEARFDKTEARFDKLESKIDKVTEDVAELRTDSTRVETELKGSIGILDQKIDGLTKRVDTQDFINRGVIVGLVLTILGGFAKVFGLVPR